MDLKNDMQPSKNHNVIIYPALIIISFMLLYGQNISQPAWMYDEGNVAYNSHLVKEGKVPYKDFWAVYAPGQYYAVAAAFAMAGESLHTLRVWDFLLRTGVLFIVYLIAAGLVGTLGGIITWLIALIWMCYWYFYGYPSIPAILFCLLAVFFFRRFVDKGALRELFFAGMGAGVCSLFRHDFGAYVFIVITMMLVVLYFLSGKEGKYIKGVGLFLSGTAVVLAYPVIYFIMHVPAGTLIYDLVTYPITVMPQYRHIPYPRMDLKTFLDIFRDSATAPFMRMFFLKAPFYFPFIAIVFSIYAMALAASGRSKNAVLADKLLVMTLLFSALDLIFVVQAFSRPDHVHLQPFLILAIILQVSAFALLKHTGRAPWKITLGVLILANACMLFYPGARFYEMSKPGISTAGVLSGTDRELLAYIDKNVPQEEYLFSCNFRQDKILYNNVMIYFLSGRESPSIYASLDPGVITTEPVQQDVIRSLRDKKVRFILMFSFPPNASEPNKSSLSSGVFTLDRYIRDNYSPDVSYGDYTFWKVKKGRL